MPQGSAMVFVCIKAHLPPCLGSQSPLAGSHSEYREHIYVVRVS